MLVAPSNAILGIPGGIAALAVPIMASVILSLAAIAPAAYTATANTVPMPGIAARKEKFESSDQIPVPFVDCQIPHP
jgi:hypothetical protein